jgi:6-phosphogluconolactonase
MTDQSQWPQTLYVGTYTAPHAAPGEARASEAHGIYVFDRFEDGSLALVQMQPAENPSYLAMSPDRKTLYAVSELGADKKGAPSGTVLAFSRDPQTGTLSPLNSQPTRGTWPCHLSVTPDGRHLLVANYGSGGFTVFAIEPDGRIGPLSDTHDIVGHGPDSARQSQSHPHYFSEHAEFGLVLGADLGTDRVHVWTRDAKSGQLTPQVPAAIQTSGGTGPRHLVVHPETGKVLVLNELSSTIDVFSRPNVSDGAIWQQTLSTLPQDSAFKRSQFDSIHPGLIAEGGNTTAEIRLHPNGRFVYVTNRGMNSVAVFAFDPSTGRLEPRSWTSSRGERPRGMNLSPDGRFMYVENQGSNTIVVFAIDPQSGALSDPIFEIPCPTPVDFAF